MTLTISQFRIKLFDVVNQAMEGKEVWVSHKGRRFRIVPEGKPVSRFSRVTPLEIVDPASSTTAEVAWKLEMQRAWEADWDRDFGVAGAGEGDPVDSLRGTLPEPAALPQSRFSGKLSSGNGK